MPIYEYECSKCGFCFERRQRFDEEPVSLCPQCHGKARRRVCAVAVIYKGSGFYTTDSRTARPGEDSTAKAEKTETKPEKVEKPAKTDTAEKEKGVQAKEA